MEPLPRGLGRFAGLALAACAAVGLYLGASKSFGEGATGLGGATAGSEGAATSAKAIAPPPPPTFDEAAIRRIAKEEAQTLIAKAPSSSGGSSTPSRRRSSASSATTYTTPSDAGLVYARPPAGDGTTSAPAAPSAPPSGQVEQF